MNAVFPYLNFILGLIMLIYGSELVIDKSKNLESYRLFIGELSEYRDNLSKIASRIPSKATLSRTGFFSIGSVMNQFYLFYSDEDINQTFLYSFGFNGYWDTMINLSNNPHVHNSKYKRKKTPYFNIKNTFYPALADKDPVKNDVKL